MAGQQYPPAVRCRGRLCPGRRRRGRRAGRAGGRAHQPKGRGAHAGRRAGRPHRQRRPERSRVVAEVGERLSLPGLTRQSMRPCDIGKLTYVFYSRRLIMDARVEPGHDTECGASSECVRFKYQTANAPPPVFFMRRRVRRLPPRLGGAVLFPLERRGDGAPSGAPVFPSCRAPVARNAGASRRSMAAISVPRVRVSWDEGVAAQSQSSRLPAERP